MLQKFTENIAQAIAVTHHWIYHPALLKPGIDGQHPAPLNDHVEPVCTSTSIAFENDREIDNESATERETLKKLTLQKRKTPKNVGA